MQIEDSLFRQHESKQKQNPASQLSSQSIDAQSRDKVYPTLLQQSLETSKWCFWHWDLSTDRIEFDLDWLQSLGLSYRFPKTRQEFAQTLIHGEDLEFVRAIRQKLISGETSSWEIVYRLIPTNHKNFAILERGKITAWDCHHQPLRVTGSQELIDMGWDSDRFNVSNPASDLLDRIREKIATHGRFDSLFRSICEDIRSFLGAERVLVYQLFSHDKNIIASIANASPLISESQLLDSFPLNSEDIKSYTQGEIQIIPNIARTHSNPLLAQYLRALKIKSCTVVPILEHRLREPELIPQPRLWGLLVAHHNYPFPLNLQVVPSISQPQQTINQIVKQQNRYTRVNAKKHLEFNSELLLTLKQVSYLLEIALQKKNLAQYRENAIATLQKAEIHAQELQTHLEQTQTELAKSQEKLVNTEQFAVLGRIIQNIVSEISNPIDFIYTTLKSSSQYAEDVIRLLELHQSHINLPDEFVAKYLPQVDGDSLKTELLKSLWSMRAGSDRLQSMIFALQQFTPSPANQVLEYDLNIGINSCLRILERRLKANTHSPGIQVIKDFAQIPQVECYPSEINQVLLHLLNNAIDAIEERLQSNYSFAPTLRIRTAVTRSHLSVISHSPNSNNGEGTSQTRQYFKHKIAIAITDNGIGILPHIQRQIFTPFFTTKPDSQFAGLGLTTSKYIIENMHHGRIRCNSQFGQGTEIIFELNPTIN